MAITSTIETNYEDEKFKQVDESIAKQETQIDQTYGGMINNTDQYYNDLKDATQQWADKQTQIQQENTDFAIEKIEQQKDQANADYLKEQSAAYGDWQKQSNKYGVEAEKMASSGLANSGFSESSQVSMYNTYQNRVATARESYNKAVLNYDNAIKDAQLQNNAALAEIAYQSLQQQLELSLQGFQYKNQLILEQSNKKLELENVKWNRYQDVLQQINTENALKLEIEKHNDTQAWNTEQAELNRKHDLERDKINNAFAEKLEGIKHDYDIKYLNAKTAKDKELAKQDYEYKVKLAAQEQKDALARLDKQLANDKALASYTKSLNSASIGGGSNISTYEAVKATGGGMADIVRAKNSEVNTAYYQGTKNKDCANGTFANGYQPDNVNGNKLTKTGKTTTVKTTIKYGDNKGQKVSVKQNIWIDKKTGKKYLWDGVNNKYIVYK